MAQARAKINLGLEIIGRRPDGFHDVVTILQEVDLADTLTFEEAPALELDCDDPSLASETNLVLRAANRLRQATGVSQGAKIHLHKAIPTAAGLGGGSADAAATLLGLSRLWDIDVESTDLTGIARELGADVAFFLRGGTQIATGRGDELTPLPTADFWAVLLPVSADVPDKTRRLYAALEPADWSDGRSVTAIADALRQNQPVSTVPRSGFERATLEFFPATRQAFATARASGASPILCGAGPTVMSLHRDRDEAEALARDVSKRGYRPIVVRSMPGGNRLTGG